MSPRTEPTEPGWYDDPHTSNHQLYWNGTRWTGETRPHPVRARKQARVAGWVLLAIIIAALIGMSANSENWIGRAMFFMFGGLAAFPALIVFVSLNRRANRIEQDVLDDAQDADT